MSRTGRIREWLSNDGGSRTLTEILDALGLKGRERRLAASTIIGMSGKGWIRSSGDAGTRRYSMAPGFVYQPTRAERIKRWLRENPGYHFAGDVCDGMGILDADDRARYARSLSNMAETGLVLAKGRATYMKYMNGRDPLLERTRITKDE